MSFKGTPQQVCLFTCDPFLNINLILCAQECVHHQGPSMLDSKLSASVKYVHTPIHLFEMPTGIFKMCERMPCAVGMLRSKLMSPTHLHVII